MKKILLLILVLALIFVFSACKEDKNNTRNSTISQEVTSEKVSQDAPHNNLEGETLVQPKNYFEEKSNLGIDYLLHKPVRQTDKKYPLIIFLHGLNDKVYKSDLGIASTLVLSLIKYENESDDYSAYTLIPTTPESGSWQPSQFENLKTLITTTINHENIDPKRVYMAGVSMGGWTVCRLINEMPPNTFAAAIPFSGCNNLQNPELHLNTAFRIYHNANDTIVNESCTIALNQQLLNAGHKNTDYEIFAFGDHGTCVNIVFLGNATTFFPWLFEQRLP